MDEDDDGGGWEDAAFGARHLHNRNDRARHSARHGFDVRSTLGTHLVRCAALDRLQEAAAAEGEEAAPPPRPGPGGGGGGRRRSSASGATTRPASGNNHKKKKKTTRSHSGGSGGGGSGTGGGTGTGTGDVVLEIYRVADGGEGLLGLLRLPGVFEAHLVLAGRRKALSRVLARHLRPGGRGRALHGGTNGEEEEDDDDDDDDEEEEEDDDGGEERSSDGHRRRSRRAAAATLEKNALRQPRFWFRWQGVVGGAGEGDEGEGEGDDDDDDDGEGEGDGAATARRKAHGSGCVVFSGNDCRRFQGTMTSAALGWNNVRMDGFKTRPQPERDFAFRWHGME